VIDAKFVFAYCFLFECGFFLSHTWNLLNIHSRNLLLNGKKVETLFTLNWVLSTNNSYQQIIFHNKSLTMDIASPSPAIFFMKSYIKHVNSCILDLILFSCNLILICLFNIPHVWQSWVSQQFLNSPSKSSLAIDFKKLI
jgi:hypothetical protein